MIVLLTLFNSLQLISAFNAAKKVGRSLRTSILTTGTVAYGQASDYSKENVALHEAGHAVIASLQGSYQLKDAKINRLFMNLYKGNIRVAEMHPEKMLVTIFAGPCNDLQNKNKLSRANFLEQELGLPLSCVFKDTHSQLDDMHQIAGYYDDLQMIYNFAHKVAQQELAYNYSFSEKQKIEREDQIIMKAFKDTKKLVCKNQSAIQAVGEALAENEYLSGYKIRAIISKILSNKE